MAIRFAAVSALALAAALIVAPGAQAQSFFSFYEMSPRQIVGMLADDGFDLRGPLRRRGDVYVCDVVSISGRPLRLIVDARDGHVIQRFAETPTPRWRGGYGDEDSPRPPRDVAGDDRDDPPSGQPHHGDMALGDIFTPPSRVYGNDSLFAPKPDPSPSPDAGPKPKRHAVKKHRDPSVAKAPATAPSPDATDAKASDKPADSTPVAAVAPSAPEARKPDPAPAPPPVETPKPAPTQAKAEPERHVVSAAPAAPAPAPAPKPESPRKKINDLPVGTLD